MALQQQKTYNIILSPAEKLIHNNVGVVSQLQLTTETEELVSVQVSPVPSVTTNKDFL